MIFFNLFVWLSVICDRMEQCVKHTWITPTFFFKLTVNTVKLTLYLFACAPFQLLAIENDPLLNPLEKEQRKRMCLTFSLQNIGSLDKYCKYTMHTVDITVEFNVFHFCFVLFKQIIYSTNFLRPVWIFPINLKHGAIHDCHAFNQFSLHFVTANLDDLSGLLQNSSQPVNIPGSQLSNSISGRCPPNEKNTRIPVLLINSWIIMYILFFSGLLQGTSAPVNIPGSTLNNFSPNNHSNLFNVADPFGPLSGSAPKINNSFGPNENLFFQPHLISPGLGDTLSMSPDIR